MGAAHNLINAVVLSAGKYLICLVPTGRSRVQLRVENIFDCNSSCETSLGEWAHRQYWDLQSFAKRLQDLLVANGHVGAVFVSRSFPAQACTSAVWDVILLPDYFDPRTLAAVNQMMCLLVLAWCFLASKHGMVGGCKASLHFYASFTPL